MWSAGSKGAPGALLGRADTSQAVQLRLRKALGVCRVYSGPWVWKGLRPYAQGRRGTKAFSCHTYPRLLGDVSWSSCNLALKVMVFLPDILMVSVWSTDTHLPPRFPRNVAFSFRASQSFGIFALFTLHVFFLQVIQQYTEIRVSLKTNDYLLSISYIRGS